MTDIIDALAIAKNFRKFKIQLDENVGHDDYKDIDIQCSYEEGLKSFLKMLWHPTSELPEGKRMILCEYEYNKKLLYKVYAVNVQSRLEYFAKNITRWCYIDDLIGEGIDL